MGNSKLTFAKLKDLKIKVFNVINIILIITMFVQNEINNESGFVFKKKDFTMFCTKFSSQHNMRVNDFAFVLIVLSYFEPAVYIYEAKKHLANTV